MKAPRRRDNRARAGYLSDAKDAHRLTIQGTKSRAGRRAFLEDVFHARANGYFPFGVGEDVELVFPESREDGVGDLARRHPSRPRVGAMSPTVLRRGVGPKAYCYSV